MNWKDSAIDHALSVSPLESCGLLIVKSGKEHYFPCKNLSTDKDSFLLNPADYALAEEQGEVLAVIHSHPVTPAVASPEDRVCCESSGLPWYIVNPHTLQWASIKPEGYIPPLCGRPWVWKHSDCWSLIRDWYLRHGVELRDWDRPVTPEDFNNKPLFDKCWNDTGFYPLPHTEELLPGDCILIALHNKQLNHVAVYVGNNQILHHQRNRLSSIDNYTQRWKDITGRVLRYHNREALVFNNAASS